MATDKNSICCNGDCNQGRTCPVRLGTYKPAEAVHQIAEQAQHGSRTAAVLAKLDGIPEHIIRIATRIDFRADGSPPYVECGDGNVWANGCNLPQEMADAIRSAFTPAGGAKVGASEFKLPDYHGKFLSASAQAAPAAQAVNTTIPLAWGDRLDDLPVSRADLERVLDEWIGTTGALPRDSGWRGEVLGMLLDAYDLGRWQAEPSAAPAPAAVAVPERWCPDVCPITGRPFFMWVTHHDTDEDVPTYGGPFDSYTIPIEGKDGIFECERYDHDAGAWREWEDVGLILVADQSLVIAPDNARYAEIEAFAALAATPPAQSQTDCQRCKGSGEDPEGYFDQSRGPDGGTHEGPCRACDGSGAAPQAQDVQREWLQPGDMEALQRFEETTSDDQSYDIGKEAVKRLAHFGCLESHGFGRYGITAFGSYVLGDWARSRELPFKTQADRDAEQRAAIAASAAQGERDA